MIWIMVVPSSEATKSLAKELSRNLCCPSHGLLPDEAADLLTVFLSEKSCDWTLLIPKKDLKSVHYITASELIMMLSCVFKRKPVSPLFAFQREIRDKFVIYLDTLHDCSSPAAAIEVWLRQWQSSAIHPVPTATVEKLKTVWQAHSKI